MHGCRIRVRTQALVLAAAVGAFLANAPSAAGQLELGVMQGTVTDEEGRPIEGAVLKLRDPGRGRVYEIKSDKNGKFYRRGLPPVEFEFTLEKDGYQPLKDKVQVAAGRDDRRFDFKLVKAAPQGAEEFVKGVEAFKTGDAEKAVAFFEEAARKAPEAPEVHVNLALAYLRVKRHDDAIKELEKAAALAPNEPRTLFQLGGAYVDAGKYDKAAEALEKGLTLQPDLSDTLAFESTVTLGAVYFAQGKIEEAIARFEKAQAVKPDAPGPKLGLAKCAFSKGDVEKALKMLKDVVATAPGTPEATEAEAFIKALEKKDRPAA